MKLFPVSSFDGIPLDGLKLVQVRSIPDTEFQDFCFSCSDVLNCSEIAAVDYTPEELANVRKYWTRPGMPERIVLRTMHGSGSKLFQWGSLNFRIHWFGFKETILGTDAEVLNEEFDSDNENLRRYIELVE